MAGDERGGPGSGVTTKGERTNVRVTKHICSTGVLLLLSISITPYKVMLIQYVYMYIYTFTIFKTV